MSHAPCEFPSLPAPRASRDVVSQCSSRGHLFSSNEGLKFISGSASQPVHNRKDTFFLARCLEKTHTLSELNYGAFSGLSRDFFTHVYELRLNRLSVQKLIPTACLSDVVFVRKAGTLKSNSNIPRVWKKNPSHLLRQ